MRIHRHRIDATILGAASLFALAVHAGVLPDTGIGIGLVSVRTDAGTAAADVTGRWISADRTLRWTFGADGRYIGSVAGRTRPAHGTYRLDGRRLLMYDESGLPTAGVIDGDALELAGHWLRRVHPATAGASTLV